MMVPERNCVTGGTWTTTGTVRSRPPNDVYPGRPAVPGVPFTLG